MDLKVPQFPKWQYDEMQPNEVNYLDCSKVRAYDLKINKLRNTKKESSEILKQLDLPKNANILEMGAGTGAFSIEAAKQCTNVFAVDISSAMLKYAKQKAEAEQLKNIEFHQEGFLTYEHKGEPLDAIVSQFALHHLPDFWKLVALKRLYGMLKKEGKFYLKDTVYSFDVEHHKKFFDSLLDEISATDGGAYFAEDVKLSISTEYPTLDWIMESLIKRAGFSIENAEYADPFLAEYLCIKNE